MFYKLRQTFQPTSCTHQTSRFAWSVLEMWMIATIGKHSEDKTFYLYVTSPLQLAVVEFFSEASENNMPFDRSFSEALYFQKEHLNTTNQGKLSDECSFHGIYFKLYPTKFMDVLQQTKYNKSSIDLLVDLRISSHVRANLKLERKLVGFSYPKSRDSRFT